MRKTLLGLLLAMISGVMLIVSWPATGNLWPLVFVAFVPMFLAQYRFMPRRLTGLPVGIAFACYWFGGLQMASSLVGIWPVIALSILIGLIGWLIGSFDKRFAERTRYRWFIVQFALIWVAIDLLVQGNLVSASMSWIAYRLWELPRLVQPVSVVGTPVLSFLIIMINALIALLTIKLLDGWRPKFCPQAIPRKVITWSSVVVVVAIVVWVASSLFIFASVHHDQGPAVTVTAVQPGIKYAPPQITKGSWKPLPPAENDRRRDAQEIQMTSMTKQAAREGARLVVWPEWLLDYDPRTTRTRWIPDLARLTHAYIIAAFVPHPTIAETPNMCGLWAPDGSLRAVYYKIHPVIPMGEKFHDTPEVYRTFDTALGPLSMMICFDCDFPPESRLLTLTGAELIGAPSAGPAGTSRFRISSLVFRAIENRVPYDRADLAWESVIVGPDGVVKKRTAMTGPAGGTALLVAAVNRGPRNAPYTRIGDIAGLIILFFLGCRIIWQIVYWRRTRGVKVVGEAGA